MDILEKLRLSGIIPILTVQNEEDAAPLAHALLSGGLRCAEVTFRTGAAKNAGRRPPSATSAGIWCAAGSMRRRRYEGGHPGGQGPHQALPQS